MILKNKDDKMSCDINLERMTSHAITRWPPSWSGKSPVRCAEKLV